MASSRPSGERLYLITVIFYFRKNIDAKYVKRFLKNLETEDLDKCIEYCNKLISEEGRCLVGKILHCQFHSLNL